MRFPLPAVIDLQCQKSRVDADVRQQAAAAIIQQPSHKTPRLIPTQIGAGSPKRTRRLGEPTDALVMLFPEGPHTFRNEQTSDWRACDENDFHDWPGCQNL